MTDLAPPSLDMWVFAGAGAGALLTWMIMRMGGRNAYQHGFDHGRNEREHELEGRITALERERAQLQAALKQLAEERGRAAAPAAAAPPDAAGDPGPAPAGRG